MFLYVPIRECLCSPLTGPYRSTGIRVFCVSAKKLKEVTFIADVSCVELEVTNLAFLCTAGQLDPIHLTDVIEDFLL